MNWENKAEMIAGRLQEAELFSKRFGSFAKTDYETLMFSIYLEMLDKPARDYDISLELGITETKVRNLRVRAQLVYPKDIQWVSELTDALKRGYYNKNDQTVTLMFENPSVQSQIKNLVEIEHGNVFMGFNRKQLCLPLEDLLLLASRAEENENEAIANLNEEWLITKKHAQEITKETLGKRIWNKTTQVTDIVSVFTTAATVWPQAMALLNGVAQLLTGGT